MIFMTSSPALMDERPTPIIHLEIQHTTRTVGVYGPTCHPTWTACARSTLRRINPRITAQPLSDRNQGAPQLSHCTSCIRWSRVGKGAEGGMLVLAPAAAATESPSSCAGDSSQARLDDEQAPTRRVGGVDRAVGGDDRIARAFRRPRLRHLGQSSTVGHARDRERAVYRRRDVQRPLAGMEVEVVHAAAGLDAPHGLAALC